MPRTYGSGCPLPARGRAARGCSLNMVVAAVIVQQVCMGWLHRLSHDGLHDGCGPWCSSGPRPALSLYVDNVLVCRVRPSYPRAYPQPTSVDSLPCCGDPAPRRAVPCWTAGAGDPASASASAMIGTAPRQDAGYVGPENSTESTSSRVAAGSRGPGAFLTKGVRTSAGTCGPRRNRGWRTVQGWATSLG